MTKSMRRAKWLGKGTVACDVCIVWNWNNLKFGTFFPYLGSVWSDTVFYCSFMVVLDIKLKRSRLAKVCVACDVFIVFFQCILSIMFAFFSPYSVSWYFRLWVYESFINVIPNLFFFFAYLVFFSMLRYFLTLYFSFTSIYFSCKWINVFKCLSFANKHQFWTTFMFLPFFFSLLAFPPLVCTYVSVCFNFHSEQILHSTIKFYPMTLTFKQKENSNKSNKFW